MLSGQGGVALRIELRLFQIVKNVFRPMKNRGGQTGQSRSPVFRSSDRLGPAGFFEGKSPDHSIPARLR